MGPDTVFDPAFALDSDTAATAALYIAPNALAVGARVRFRVTITVANCPAERTCGSETSTVDVLSIANRLSLSIAGGSFRTVGASETLTMQASTGLGSVNQAASFAWTVRDDVTDAPLAIEHTGKHRHSSHGQ